MNHNLFEKDDLKYMQATGKWPAIHSCVLEKKYADRYERAGALFDVLNEDLFLALNDINDKQTPTVNIVRDPNIHNRICEDIKTWLIDECKSKIIGLVESPIKGPKGNIEFLVVAKYYK